MAGLCLGKAVIKTSATTGAYVSAKLVCPQGANCGSKKCIPAIRSESPESLKEEYVEFCACVDLPPHLGGATVLFATQVGVVSQIQPPKECHLILKTRYEKDKLIWADVECSGECPSGTPANSCVQHPHVIPDGDKDTITTEYRCFCGG